MNEQTKTQLAHMSEITVLKQQINELQSKYEERFNMCELLHIHIGDLNKQIIDLKTQMTVASDCHDLRIKHLNDRDILIQQLEMTISDVLQYLKIDSNSQYLDFETRIYCDKIIDLLFVQYYENTGTDLIKND